MSHGARGDRRRVTVVGNGVAGYACAARAAQHGLPVTMIGPGLPHDRPPLSKRALTTGRLPLLADGDALAAAGIEHVDGTVTTVRAAERLLRVSLTGGGEAEVASPGPLVWATGVRHLRPPGLDDAHLIATAAGFEAAAARLCDGERRHVAVVGAGLVGTEAAASLGARHEVTLLDLTDRPLARLHDPLPALAAAALAERGVRFLARTPFHDGIAADTVVVAAGTAPSTAPPAVPLEVDARCRVPGADGLLACGDCATLLHPRLGRVDFPHWDWARRMGRHAADSIAGDTAPFDEDPFWFSTIGSLHLQEVGLAERAQAWEERDGLWVGRAPSGEVAAVLLVSAPARLAEARELLGGRYCAA